MLQVVNFGVQTLSLARNFKVDRCLSNMLRQCFAFDHLCNRLGSDRLLLSNGAHSHIVDKDLSCLEIKAKLKLVLPFESVTVKGLYCLSLRGLWLLDHNGRVSAYVSQVEVPVALNLTRFKTDCSDCCLVAELHLSESCVNLFRDDPILQIFLEWLLLVLNNISQAKSVRT